MRDPSPSISIIVPTFNEETTIGPLIDNLAALSPEEILVADGGSSDRTVEIASQRVRVLRTQTSRALQMNAGAQVAGGDVLLFLHADARLGPGALNALREAMREPEVPGGNFDVIYDGADWVAHAFTSIIDHCINNAMINAKKGGALTAGCSREVSLAIYGCGRWSG